MIDPWWITGLTDGEGCFSLFVHRDKQKRIMSGARIYYRWQAVFIITLRGDDRKILEKLKEYFKCGSLNISFPKETALLHKFGKVEYAIRNLHDLKNIIIPHFNKFPLQSKKKEDFEFWKEAVIILESYRTDSTPFKKIIISEEDKSRLNEFHLGMRKRVSGTRKTWNYKNLLLDGITSIEDPDGQLALI